MQLSFITKNDIENVARLAGKCFIDDSFYIELSKSRAERKKRLSTYSEKVLKFA